MNMQNMVQMMLMSNPAMANNPQIKQAMELASRGDTQALRGIAEGICQQKGININDAINQLKNMRF